MKNKLAAALLEIIGAGLIVYAIHLWAGTTATILTTGIMLLIVGAAAEQVN